MSSYLTTDTFGRTLELPLQVPQLELLRNDSLVLATVVLQVGQKFRLRWLNLTLYGTDQTTAPSKVNSGLGIVYVGLFGPKFNGPTGWPLTALSNSLISSKATNPWDYVDVQVAGTYGLVLVNNTRNLDVSVGVSGLARLFSHA